MRVSKVQVTGDINIASCPVIEKAFKPGLVFLEGQFPDNQIKKWLLDLMLIDKKIYKLELPISNPYKSVTSTVEYRIDYSELAVNNQSNITLKINIKELIDSLKGGLTADKDNLYIDNTSFMEEFINVAIKKLKDTNEYNSIQST
jgi:hypothetical protein